MRDKAICLICNVPMKKHSSNDAESFYCLKDKLFETKKEIIVSSNHSSIIYDFDSKVIDLMTKDGFEKIENISEEEFAQFFNNFRILT